MEKENKQITARLIKITAALSAVIIIASAAAGYLIPKSDETILRALMSLEKNDKTYLAVKQENAEAKLENEKLTKDSEEKQKELDEFRSSQDNLDKITESNNALESERDILKDETQKKQKELDELKAMVEAYANKIMTFTSGDYTVGSEIAAGKYMITGTGSIAIASGGRSKANKLLKADGESFTLSAGDLIHIEGNAKIVPQ